MIQKICFITGSRADYGLIANLMKLIKSDRNLELQLIATGTHFSNIHGNTYSEILKDNFKINAQVDLGIKNSQADDVCNYMSLAIKGISKKLEY